MVRYADDILIFKGSRKGAEHALKMATEVLEKELKLATRRNTPVNLEKVIGDINPILRGFVNYFKLANCKSVL